MSNKFSTVDIMEPTEGMVLYLNRFWLCVDGDPTKALFYCGRPQCNKNKGIAESVWRNKLYKDWNPKVVFVETAYVPEINE